MNGARLVMLLALQDCAVLEMVASVRVGIEAAIVGQPQGAGLRLAQVSLGLGFVGRRGGGQFLQTACESLLAEPKAFVGCLADPRPHEQPMSLLRLAPEIGNGVEAAARGGDARRLNPSAAAPRKVACGEDGRQVVCCERTGLAAAAVAGRSPVAGEHPCGPLAGRVRLAGEPGVELGRGRQRRRGGYWR